MGMPATWRRGRGEEQRDRQRGKKGKTGVGKSEVDQEAKKGQSFC